MREVAIFPTLLADRKFLPCDVPSLSIEEAVNSYFYRYKHGGFPVLDSSELKGIITMRGIMKTLKEEWPRTYVKDMMTLLKS